MALKHHFSLCRRAKCYYCAGFQSHLIYTIHTTTLCSISVLRANSTDFQLFARRPCKQTKITDNSHGGVRIAIPNKFFAFARAHTPAIVYQESTKTLKCCNSANSLNFLTMLGSFKGKNILFNHNIPPPRRNKNHDTDRYSHYLGIL